MTSDATSLVVEITEGAITAEGTIVSDETTYLADDTTITSDPTSVVVETTENAITAGGTTVSGETTSRVEITNTETTMGGAIMPVATHIGSDTTAIPVTTSDTLSTMTTKINEATTTGTGKTAGKH